MEFWQRYVFSYSYIMLQFTFTLIILYYVVCRLLLYYPNFICFYLSLYCSERSIVFYVHFLLLSHRPTDVFFVSICLHKAEQLTGVLIDYSICDIFRPLHIFGCVFFRTIIACIPFCLCFINPRCILSLFSFSLYLILFQFIFSLSVSFFWLLSFL